MEKSDINFTYQCNILHYLLLLKMRVGILLQMRKYLSLGEAYLCNCEIIWPPNA